jgi:hypothetical protein
MAFTDYLKISGTPLPLPDSYDLSLSDVEADTGGETEAGTTQRDVVRTGGGYHSSFLQRESGVA